MNIVTHGTKVDGVVSIQSMVANATWTSAATTTVLTAGVLLMTTTLTTGTVARQVDRVE